MTTTKAWRKEVAVDLLRYGLALFRICPRSKSPVKGSKWKKESLKGDELERWIEGGGNIGVKTGSAKDALTQVIVLDVDNKKALEYAGNTLGLKKIKTWTVKTKKGYHFYFQAPQDREIHNSESKIFEGIDVRGEGGYIIGPGSLHEDGDTYYRWVKGLKPGECDLAPCPEFLRLLSIPKMEEGVFVPANDKRILKNEDNPIARFPGVAKGRRHKEACRLAGILVAQEVGDSAGWKALARWNTMNQPPMGELELQRIWKDIQALDRENHPERYIDRRPVIWLNDELVEIVDNMEKALAMVPPSHKHAVFNREGILTGVMHDMTGTRIKNLTLPLLQERLSVACRFRKPGSGRNLTPRAEHMKILLERGEYHELPVLDWLTFAPCFTEDGPVRRPGYDPVTRIYAAFKEEDWELPDFSKKSNKELVGILLDPFVDFGMRGSSLEAVLCALLSFPARPLIRGPIPLFAISSPIRGSGKTLLARVISIMMTGNEPPMTLPCQNQEEGKKSLFVTALEGRPVIVFDNQDSTLAFGYPALAAALTSGSIRDRILGRSRSVSAPWRSICFVTGNHLKLRSDLGRRSMSIFLNPGCSRPELRHGFKYPDLIDVIHRRKHIYLSAAMELVKRNDGNVGITPVIGGFESWDRWVRQAVYKATGRDPLQSFLGTANHMDIETEQRENFLSYLRLNFGTGPIELKEILEFLRVDPNARHVYLEAFHLEDGDETKIRKLKKNVKLLVGLYHSGYYFIIRNRGPYNPIFQFVRKRQLKDRAIQEAGDPLNPGP